MGGTFSSAGLQSLTFLGGESGGMNSINSLNQTSSIKSSPSTVPTSWVNDGPPPQNFNPITSPQFFNNETSGPFAFLGKRYYNETVNNNPTTSNGSNYLEYILLIGGAAIIIIIIAKNKNNS